jgi:hypothetical protein
MIEFINISLFIFWISGCISILVDMDHIWGRTGREPPVNYSKWKTRPLHTSGIFLIVAILYSIFICTFIFRFYVQVATSMGVLGTLSALSGLNIVMIICLREFDKFVIKRGLNLE